MVKILGTTTTYHGTEHRYLNGYRVRIIAILKNAAWPDIDVDGPDYAHIEDEDELARAGGVTGDDRVEVQPWLEKEGRFSFVASDHGRGSSPASRISPRPPARSDHETPPARVVRAGFTPEREDHEPMPLC